jgi:hypothetical protein
MVLGAALRAWRVSAPAAARPDQLRLVHRRAAPVPGRMGVIETG